MPSIHLPSLNACLNAVSAFFLLCGYVFIKRKNIPFHRAAMTGAVVSSTLFLISYLYYHANAGVTRFQGQGWIRPVYFFILTTHTILAVVILPLVLATLIRAWKNQFDRHARVARWTWPLWMYVSVTGVVIYWMVYRM